MTDPLGNFGHLTDGKVEIFEARSDYRISSHVAEVHDTESGQLELRSRWTYTLGTWIANRIRRKPLDIAVGPEWVGDERGRQKGSTEIAYARRRAIGNRNIQRIDGLNLHDAVRARSSAQP